MRSGMVGLAVRGDVTANSQCDGFNGRSVEPLIHPRPSSYAMSATTRTSKLRRDLGLLLAAGFGFRVMLQTKSTDRWLLGLVESTEPWQARQRRA